MPTVKSGAFVQQCFAAHPFALAIKTLTADRITVMCRSCDLRHRVTVRALVTDSPAQCATAHMTELHLSGMDVLRDAVQLRCGECRRLYDIAVSAFETYLPG